MKNARSHCLSGGNIVNAERVSGEVCKMKKTSPKVAGDVIFRVCAVAKVGYQNPGFPQSWVPGFDLDEAQELTE